MIKYNIIRSYKKLSLNKIISSNFSKRRKKWENKRTILKFLFIIILSNILFFFNNNLFNFISGQIAFISKPSKKIKACVCVIGKRENLYAKEYVNYYKSIGYNHIFIYDNNEENDEKFEDVLQEEIKSKFVTIIDLRGNKARFLVGGPQCYAFKDCYKNNNKDYDWLSFFDFDEFLEVRPKSKNIQEYFGNKMFDKCINIKINFLFYSDNELLYYDPRPLQERFTTPLYDHGNNGVIKSTIKGGLGFNYWEKGCTPHTSVLTNVTSCTSFGEVIPFNSWYYKANFTYAALKHYYSKTVEEYANKSARGDALNIIKWDENQKRNKIENYFIYNKRTEEKVNLFKKIFNIT